MRQSALALLTVPATDQRCMCDWDPRRQHLLGRPPATSSSPATFQSRTSMEMAPSSRRRSGWPSRSIRRSAGSSLPTGRLNDAVATNPSVEKGVQNVSQMIDDPASWPWWLIHLVTSPLDDDPSSQLEFPGDDQPLKHGRLPDVVRSELQLVRESLRPSGLNNYFRLPPPDAVQGTAMARYIAETGR